MKVAIALAFALTLIVGWHALSGEWLPGDELLGRASWYRPVLTASLAADRAIWEGNAAGYHLANLFYHAAAGVLVYGLARQVSLPERTALVAAALWVVHPAHVDAFAPVGGRREVLVGVFYLLALLAFLRSSLFGLVLASALAAYTKEMALTLPAVALALELALRGPDRRRLALFAGWALAMGALVSHSMALGRTGLPGAAWTGRTLVDAAGAFAHYLYLAAWPWHLAADYSTAVLDFAGHGVAAVVVYAALAGYWARRRPLAAAALVAFALALSPALLLVATPEVLAEHTLHVPLAAFAILAAAAASPALERWPRGAAVAAGLLIAVLGVRTHARCRVWHDWHTLVATTVADQPACARARTNLGLVLEGQGRYAEAEREYRIALAILPGDVATLSNLGSLLMLRGAFGEAKGVLTEAVSRAPGYVEALNNLGAVLTELGELDAAERRIRAALAVRPDHAAALLNLGLVLRRAGGARAAEAEAVIRRAMLLDPENASAYNNLGALYMSLSRFPEAVQAFQRAVALQPAHARGIVNLARALASVGQARAAEEALIRAASTEPAGTVQLECARLALDWKLPRLAKALYAKARAAGSPDPELAARLEEK